MATSLTDRLTVAIRTAEQSMVSAQYQADYRNWHEVHRLLQDVRDELGKPQSVIGAARANAMLAEANKPSQSDAFVAEMVKRGPGRPRKEAA